MRRGGAKRGGEEERVWYALWLRWRSAERSWMSVAKLSIVRDRAQMWVWRFWVCHLFRWLFVFEN